MHWLLALPALFFMTPVFALGLGEIEGRAIVGRALQVQIPILGFQGDKELVACVSLTPESDDEDTRGIRMKVEGDRIYLSTVRMLTQPIIQFRIRLGCSYAIERSFMVLPLLAQHTDSVPTPKTRALESGHNPQPATLPPAVPKTSGQRSIVLMSNTSLRMLSRQRYPSDADARVRFIRSVAAANADLFGSEDVAFDQRLALGTRLVIPQDLPIPQPSGRASTSTVAGSTERPLRHNTPEASVTVKAKQALGVRSGRLIVGAEGLPAAGGPNVAELSKFVDQLIEMMNEQVLLQITMVKRIESAETELADLKRQLRAEKARATQTESEVRALREAAERRGVIELVLAVLLGGVAGAWLLSWMLRHRAEAEKRPVVIVPPARTMSPKKDAQRIPSVFDELPDSREDILPPGTLR